MMIPISINFDDNFIIPAKVAVYSMRKSTPIEIELYFFVLCDDRLSKEKRIEFVDFLDKLENTKVDFCDIDNKNYTGAKSNAHIAITAYYRLSSAAFIPFDRCIYIDCDTIVDTNLFDLYSEEIDENYIGAVRDIIMVTKPNTALKHKQKCCLKSLNDYINSGVMIMNLKKMRKDNVLSLFEKEITSNNPYLDQDVINRVCHGKIKIIDWTYNHISYYKDDIYRIIFGESGRNNKGQIIHYAMGTKPWQNSSYRNASIWWNVAKKALSEKEYEKILTFSCIESNAGTIKWIADKCMGDNKIIIVGFSDIGMGVYYNLCNYGVSPERIIFCDNNIDKRKENVFCYKVVSPEQAYRNNTTATWVNTVQGQRKEIVDQLLNLGVKENNILNYYHRSIDYYKYLDEKQMLLGIGEATYFG